MASGQCLRVLRGQMPVSKTMIMTTMMMLIFQTCRAVNMVNITVAVDGTIYLRPPTAPRGDIGWKHGGNQVLEYEKGVLELFNIFEGRTELDPVTGYVNISRATKAHSGTYVLYVGIVEQPETYNVVVLDKVRKPSVVGKSLACDPHSQSCNFNCDSNVTGAGSVLYSWKVGDKWSQWQESASFELKNTKDTRKSENIYCRVSNKVSEEVSGAFKQPFKHKSIHLHAGAIAGIVVSIVFGILCILCIGFAVYKRDAVRRFCAGMIYEPASSGEGSKTNSNNVPLN